MDASVNNQLDDMLWQIQQWLRTDPDYIKRLKPRFKLLEETATNTSRVLKLQEAWGEVPQHVIRELNSKQSVPFVTLMLGLAKRRYRVHQMSTVLWWRRMIATGQENVITYFSWERFEATFTGDVVHATDIMRVCVDNEQLLNNITAALADDKCVDFKIRELLGGISMQSDVRQAWKKWAMANHPDKGGDPELFLKVKLVYDEWCEIQNELTQTKE